MKNWNELESPLTLEQMREHYDYLVDYEHAVRDQVRNGKIGRWTYNPRTRTAAEVLTPINAETARLLRAHVTDIKHQRERLFARMVAIKKTIPGETDRRYPVLDKSGYYRPAVYEPDEKRYGQEPSHSLKDKYLYF